MFFFFYEIEVIHYLNLGHIMLANETRLLKTSQTTKMCKYENSEREHKARTESARE